MTIWILIICVLVLAALVGASYAAALFGAGVIGHSEKMKKVRYNLRFRTLKLPCPYCRGEDGEATGRIQPRSQAIYDYIEDINEIPTGFVCSGCNGTKVVFYKVEKGAVVDITDDKRVAGVSFGRIEEVKR